VTETVTGISTTGNPTTITTQNAHGFANGDEVFISNVATAPGDANGFHIISNVTATTFTIPINVTSQTDDFGTVTDTKNFLGCTWSHGETKEVHPTFYKPGYFAPGAPHFQYDSYRQQWGRNTSGRLSFTASNFGVTAGTCDKEKNQGFIQKLGSPAFSSFRFSGSNERNFNLFADCNEHTDVFNSTGVSAAPNLSSWALDGNQYIKNSQFFSITTSNGVTISTSRGNNW
jgi:hypothetical protein